MNDTRNARIPIYISLLLVMGSLWGFVSVAGLNDLAAVRAAALCLGLGLGLAFLSLDTFGLLCIVMALLPYIKGLLQFEVWVITFSPYSVGLIILGCYCLSAAILGRRPYRLEAFDGWLVTLCLFFLVSTLTSADLFNSGYLAFHVIFLPVLAYFVVKLLVDTPEKYQVSFKFLLYGIVTFSLLCIPEYVLLPGRVTIFNVPPVSIATLAILPLLYFFYDDKSPSLLRWVSILSCLTSLFLTFSRVYLISLALSPLFMAAIRRGRARLLMSATMLFTLAITLLVTLNVPPAAIRSFDDIRIAAKLDKAYAEDEASAERLVNPTHWLKSMEMRALIFRANFEYFLRNPVTGSGLRMGEVLVTSHNVHLEWLEFGGVMGYVICFGIFYCYFGMFQQHAVKDRSLATNLLVVYIILVNGLTNGFMHGYFPYLAFTVFGFSCVRRDMLKQQDSTARPLVAPWGPL
jgi:hypothetical protein